MSASMEMSPSYTNVLHLWCGERNCIPAPLIDGSSRSIASQWQPVSSVLSNEDFKVDIEAFGLQQRRAYRSGVCRGGDGVCVRTVRLSVCVLKPIWYQRGTLRARLQEVAAFDQFRRVSITKSGKRRRKTYQLNTMASEMDDIKITEEQTKLATDAFKKFDKRGQEKISTNDLGPAFRALNLSIKPDQLKEWADLVDDDATGFIDLKGFLIVYGKKLMDDQDEKDLREAFRVLDKNKRGEIDVEDLRWILKGLGDDLTEEEIDEMIRDTDTDGSGFVDFNEFKKLMTSE